MVKVSPALSGASTAVAIVVRAAFGSGSAATTAAAEAAPKKPRRESSLSRPSGASTAATTDDPDCAPSPTSRGHPSAGALRDIARPLLSRTVFFLMRHAAEPESIGRVRRPIMLGPEANVALLVLLLVIPAKRLQP